MGKKCIVCDAEATYKIKDTSDYYCQECAQENFADLSLLVKVEEEAQRLKTFVEQKAQRSNASSASKAEPSTEKELEDDA